MSRILHFIRRHLVGETVPLSRAERARAAVAGFAGMLLATAILFVLPFPTPARHLLAPLGASAVVLFALPHSPLAQPWSLVGGLIVSALAGLACGHLIPVPLLAAAAAVALALLLMTTLRCLHPPGGGLALLAAGALGQGAPGLFLLAVTGSVLAMLAAALAVNNLVPGRRYPQCAPPVRTHTRAPSRLSIEHDDLQHALQEIDSYLDISEQDLVDVYNRAAAHAFRRHARVRCGDVMSRNPVTVELKTDLNAAWAMLRAHSIQSLPVVDRSGRVVGLLSIDDFLGHVPAIPGRRFGDNLHTLLRGLRSAASSKPKVVGHIMRDIRNDIVLAQPGDDLAATAASLGRRHQHAVPVVDEQRRLIGILTQGDVISGLFGQLALTGVRERVC